jgi:hypothetical protein
MINDVRKVYGKAENEKEGNIHTHSKRISPATRIEKNKFVDFWGKMEHNMLNVFVHRIASLGCEVREYK